MARIDGTTTVNTDANANEDAFRLAMKASVMAYELGGTSGRVHSRLWPTPRRRPFRNPFRHLAMFRPA